MTNVDGLYATSDIEEGTIIFTENDMPECELHRSSTDPNCEVVALDDGSSAVVSMKAITAGEFFSVLDSESEEEGEVDPPGST
jgi:U3 small nucleolar RNA-associated protein 6